MTNFLQFQHTQRSRVLIFFRFLKSRRINACLTSFSTSFESASWPKFLNQPILGQSRPLNFTVREISPESKEDIFRLVVIPEPNNKDVVSQTLPEFWHHSSETALSALNVQRSTAMTDSEESERHIDSAAATGKFQFACVYYWFKLLVVYNFGSWHII